MLLLVLTVLLVLALPGAAVPYLLHGSIEGVEAARLSIGIFSGGVAVAPPTVAGLAADGHLFSTALDISPLPACGISARDMWATAVASVIDKNGTMHVVSTRVAPCSHAEGAQHVDHAWRALAGRGPPLASVLAPVQPLRYRGSLAVHLAVDHSTPVAILALQSQRVIQGVGVCPINRTTYEAIRRRMPRSTVLQPELISAAAVMLLLLMSVMHSAASEQTPSLKRLSEPQHLDCAPAPTEASLEHVQSLQRGLRAAYAELKLRGAPALAALAVVAPVSAAQSQHRRRTPAEQRAHILSVAARLQASIRTAEARILPPLPSAPLAPPIAPSIL